MTTELATQQNIEAMWHEYFGVSHEIEASLPLNEQHLAVEAREKISTLISTLYQMVEDSHNAREAAIASMHLMAVERDKAIDELSELEEALENGDTDDWRVDELYQRAFDAGVDEGMEIAQQDLWDDDRVITPADLKEVIAFHLERPSYDPVVGSFVEALQDRHMLMNDQKAQAGLAMLASEILGDEFFNGGNDD